MRARLFSFAQLEDHMEFKFIGNPLDARDNIGGVTLYGVRFPLNVAVKVDDPAAIKKLMGNNHFAICGADGATHVQMPGNLVLPDVAPVGRANKKLKV